MFKCFFIILTLCLSCAAHADPWGQDADLAIVEPILERNNTPSAVNYVAQLAIRFHQEVISPADGPRSHFKPSSSQYTLEAIRKYGVLPGFFMGCDRLMRENSDPWVYRTIEYKDGYTWKYDPVE
ncbi:MAG: putative component of membrane protein insertase Oxa1/YidC/SpoIIIJ protein YidD [Chlamydiales bacterium]|jgi:putative component of membrane protein insertase Oxa1/YidC/SpoIIIJ protein YidD